MKLGIRNFFVFCLFSIALAGLVGCAGGATETKPAPDTKAVAKAEVYSAVPLVSRELLFGNPTKASPKLSPDGKRLAYLAPDEGVLNVWVRTVGQQDDKAITKDRKRGIRSYYWADNNTQPIYIQDKDGDENWHIWVVPVEGGEAKDMTPIAGVRAQFIGSDPSRPDELLIGLNDRDKRLHDIYLLNLKTGEKKLEFKNEMGAIGFVADHELVIRVAMVMTPDGGFKLLHRAKTKEKWADLLTVAGEDFMTSGPMFFAADNRSLYVLSSVGSNTSELRALDTQTKKETTLFVDKEADVQGSLVHPTTHVIQAVSVNKARQEWTVLDDSLADDFKKLAEVTRGDFNVTARDHADKVWLVSYVPDNGPVAYYAWDRAAKKASFLFVHRPELKDVKLTEMKPINYKARDGLSIHGYLTTPAGVEAKNLPTVIVPHGGPWHRDTWGFDGMSQWLANRGYAVLQPNFRGSTGYGTEFINKADREWGATMQDDITDGTKWLIEQGIADPKRICIMGGSYGGYATLMGLVREPDLYACGVDIVGVANLITWLQNLPPYWKPLQSLFYKRVGHLENDVEFLKSRSPVFQADKIKAPLLIAQGKNDPRVPLVESTQIRDALKARGLEVEYVEYADEGHGFARPVNRLNFFAIAEKFLAKHIGGRYEPEAAKEEKKAEK